MANSSNEPVCCGGPKLIFACSGAADVGEIADHAARKLTKEEAGSMFCLAGVGGKVDPIMSKTSSASSSGSSWRATENSFRKSRSWIFFALNLSPPS